MKANGKNRAAQAGDRAGGRVGRVCPRIFCCLTWAILSLCPAFCPSTASGAPPAQNWLPPTSPYKIQLRATARARNAGGVVDLALAHSPFDIAVSESGRYVFDLTFRVHGLPLPRGKTFVAWVATPDLTSVRKLGSVGSDGRARGRVDWNKFLVFVSAESSADVKMRKGPILLQGISPSGYLEPLSEHGLFNSGTHP